MEEQTVIPLAITSKVIKRNDDEIQHEAKIKFLNCLKRIGK